VDTFTAGVQAAAQHTCLRIPLSLQAATQHSCLRTPTSHRSSSTFTGGYSQLVLLVLMHRLLLTYRSAQTWPT
jgi:hypothetical protein